MLLMVLNGGLKIMSKLWILFVTSRFSRVDRKGRSAATSMLATLGICFGVMTLIVVMSVMNGFQMSFIDSILELSSYHVQISDYDISLEKSIEEKCKSLKYVRNVEPFCEAQTLLVGETGKESAALIRAVSPDIYFDDEGFRQEMNITRGEFDISGKNQIVLGSGLAREIGAKVGTEVNLFILSGGNDVALLSDDRRFVVTGIFSCGYSEINSTYCFINIDYSEEYFGKNPARRIGVKLQSSEYDARLTSELQKADFAANITPWRSYNKNFYSTLKIEKNMMLLFVALIFIVVAINIYNGMRRLVFERRNEIAVFSSMGASNAQIESIFILRGFITGCAGAVAGLVFGILISLNTDVVFNAASKIIYLCQYVFTAITAPETLQFVEENSSYSLYASIPARIFPLETVFITLFGIMSPLAASWWASRSVLKMKVAEVLHE